MDHKTKAKLLSLITDNAPPLTMTGNKYEGWCCKVEGNKITTDPLAAIHIAVYSVELQDYLHQHYSILTSIFWDIDWEAIDTTTAAFPPLYHLWMAKHVSGLFGCRKMVRHWQFWSHPHCPCCQAEVKDKAHLFTCLEPSCLAKWHSSVQGLHEWPKEMDTLLAITACILAALHSRDVATHFCNHHGLSLWPAATTQD